MEQASSARFGFLKSNRFRILSVVAVVLAVAPSFGIGVYGEYVLTEALVFVIVTAAWSTISGYTGQVVLGPTIFFGLGGYASAYLAARMGLSPWLGLIVGPICGLIFGLIIGLPFFRLHGPYFALATLALTEVMGLVATNEQQYTGGSVGLQIPFQPPLNILGLSIDLNSNLTQYYIILPMALACTYVMYRIAMSKAGYYFTAIRDDEDTAMSLGVNVLKYKEIAFAVCGFFTALAGAFYANFLFYVSPDAFFGIQLALIILVMGVLGGADTILGAWISGFLLTLVQEGLRVGFGAAAAYPVLIVGAMLVLLLLFLPKGIIRLFTKKRV